MRVYPCACVREPKQVCVCVRVCLCMWNRIWFC